MTANAVIAAGWHTATNKSVFWLTFTGDSSLDLDAASIFLRGCAVVRTNTKTNFSNDKFRLHFSGENSHVYM